jgi:inner membrane protein
LKRLAIHPIQYSLVGMALAMFYLLLTSLSEHIAFEIAYAIASGACIALLTFYVSYVLKSLLHGLGIGTMLALLYGALYVLLGSEDQALLLGSVLLFCLLSAVMVGTRKVDWYKVGEGLATRKRETAPAPIATATVAAN